MRRLALVGLLLSACPDDSSGESTTTAGPTSAPTCPATQDCTDPGGTTVAPTTDPGATSTGGPAADPTTGAPDSGSSTGVDPTTTSAGETTADPGTTTGGLDCAADCASCWTCAKQGACKAQYDACMLETFCVPTLFCLETMCTPDGLPQRCADTCCMSCTNLGTCQGVNAAADCIEQQCAGLCQAPTCG
jgi:hypothetical protein